MDRCQTSPGPPGEVVDGGVGGGLGGVGVRLALVHLARWWTGVKLALVHLAGWRGPQGD